MYAAAAVEADVQHQSLLALGIPEQFTLEAPERGLVHCAYVNVSQLAAGERIYFISSCLDPALVFKIVERGTRNGFDFDCPSTVFGGFISNGKLDILIDFVPQRYEHLLVERNIFAVNGQNVIPDLYMLSKLVGRALWHYGGDFQPRSCKVLVEGETKLSCCRCYHW